MESRSSGARSDHEFKDLGELMEGDRGKPAERESGRLVVMLGVDPLPGLVASLNAS